MGGVPPHPRRRRRRRQKGAFEHFFLQRKKKRYEKFSHASFFKLILFFEKLFVSSKKNFNKLPFTMKIVFTKQNLSLNFFLLLSNCFLNKKLFSQFFFSSSQQKLFLTKKRFSQQQKIPNKLFCIKKHSSPKKKCSTKTFVTQKIIHQKNLTKNLLSRYFLSSEEKNVEKKINSTTQNSTTILKK